MKSYWSIPGPTGNIPKTNCHAFYKYDGMNFRAEWSPKRDWYKFGTRRKLLDPTDWQWGKAVEFFLNGPAYPLASVFKTDRLFKGAQSIIAFFELYSDNSFGGWFPQKSGILSPEFPTAEPAKMALIDVSITKKGMVLPDDFINIFGHFSFCASLVYNGLFDEKFVQDVYSGLIVDGEGVVAKGIELGKKKSPQHSLWMRKAKTKSWLEKLKRLSIQHEEFKKMLNENQTEQNVL